MGLVVATIANLTSTHVKMDSPCVDIDRADRQPCRQKQPIQTSAVYILGSKTGSQFAPPLSPPSPITPASEEDCGPITDLSLDSKPQAPLEESIPPTPDTHSSDTRSSLHASRLASAIHSLTTTSSALTSLTSLYTNSRHARDAFDATVAIITATQQPTSPSSGKGKLVLIGVGKSGYVARKLSATLTSLGVPASFLHAAEGLHGDLGCINPNDALLFVSYSGRTPELLALLPHLDSTLPIILLTGCCCEEGNAGPEVVLARRRQQKAAGWEEGQGGQVVILPAPVHEEEVTSYGVAAPTTSTSVALALGDALAMAAAGEVHGRGSGVGSVFRRNHPGGAIGEVKEKVPMAAKTMGEVCVRWEDIHVMDQQEGALAGDILRAGYASKTGWVRLEGTDGAVTPPSRIRNLRTADLGLPARAVDGLVLRRPDLLAMAAETKVTSAVEWMRCAAEDSEGDVVIAVLERGQIAGVLEGAKLLALAAQK